jgi:hypothetical protein
MDAMKYYAIKLCLLFHTMLGGSVTTAWHILGSRIKGRPPAMEVSCEYIE